MSCSHMADPTFGINGQALAVLALLSGRENELAFRVVKTAPWYNGRERGVLFRFGNEAGPVLNVAVFEHRNSDQLCAVAWVRDGWGTNPPNISTDGGFAYPTDNKYDVSHSVPYGRAGDMELWVLKRVREFADSIGHCPAASRGED